jgi:hypothetical protein
LSLLDTVFLGNGVAWINYSFSKFCISRKRRIVFLHRRIGQNLFAPTIFAVQIY